jgi:sulfite reductase beta subunit
MSTNLSERMKKRLPVPYTDSLPEEIKSNLGKWADRKFHGGGIIEHISEKGDHLFTIKVGSPPNARFSSNTLRVFADIEDKFGIGTLRFTRSGNVEFISDSLEKSLLIKNEIEKMGFHAGGWRNSLWSIGSCTAYLSCTTAVADSSSITKVLYDQFGKYFTDEESIPAKLRISVAGCPTACGGLTSDIVVVGHYGDAPSFDPQKIGLCLPRSAKALEVAVPEVVMVCPMKCISAFKKDDDTVGIQINREKCIACGRCKDVCDYITFDTTKIGISILVGGKSSNTGRGQNLAMVLIPWIPISPPNYREVVAVLQKIIDMWKGNAVAGERLADYVRRIGLREFQKALDIPVTRWNNTEFVSSEFGIRQFPVR